MMIEMKQLINDIESIRGRSYLACSVRQNNVMSTLLIYVVTQPCLQTPIVDRIVHDGRCGMQLNRDASERQLNVIQTLRPHRSTQFHQHRS